MPIENEARVDFKVLWKKDLLLLAERSQANTNLASYRIHPFTLFLFSSAVELGGTSLSLTRRPVLSVRSVGRPSASEFEKSGFVRSQKSSHSRSCRLSTSTHLPPIPLPCSKEHTCHLTLLLSLPRCLKQILFAARRANRVLFRDEFSGKEKYLFLLKDSLSALRSRLVGNNRR